MGSRAYIQAVAAGIGAFLVSTALLLTPLAADSAPKVASNPQLPTRIAGHRGTTIGADENTLSAMDYAFQAGADYLETDIRLTSDKKMVIIHDATLDRTTNCTGRVADRTLAYIKRCSTVHRQHPPSLRQLLQRVDGYPNSIGLYLELKGTWTYSQVYKALTEAISYSMDDITFDSFSQTNLDKVMRANDALPDEDAGKNVNVALGAHTSPPMPLQQICDRYGAYFSMLDYTKTDLVHYLQEKCNPPTIVAVWGVRTDVELEQAYETGAWVIGADDPKHAVKWLANR